MIKPNLQSVPVLTPARMQHLLRIRGKYKLSDMLEEISGKSGIAVPLQAGDVHEAHVVCHNRL